MIKIFAKKLVSGEDFLVQEQEVKRYAQEATLEKIDSYGSLKNKQRKLIGEMLAFKGLEECFGLSKEDIVFTYGEKGKPMLRDSVDMFFNISHSGDWVVCAVSDKEVGLDIELIKDAKMKVANRFFSPSEIEVLDSLDGEAQNVQFFTLWTAKESYLKYLGTGLTKALNSFDVVINSEGVFVDESELSRGLRFSLIPIDDAHKMMLCSAYDADAHCVIKC